MIVGNPHNICLILNCFEIMSIDVSFLKNKNRKEKNIRVKKNRFLRSKYDGNFFNFFYF